MKLTEKGSLRILESELGFTLHKKDTDIYSLKIFLGKNDSIDNYEEVEYDGMDGRVNKRVSASESLLQNHEELMETLMLALDELYQLFELFLGL